MWSELIHLYLTLAILKKNILHTFITVLPAIFYWLRVMFMCIKDQKSSLLSLCVLILMLTLVRVSGMLAVQMSFLRHFASNPYHFVTNIAVMLFAMSVSFIMEYWASL